MISAIYKVLLETGFNAPDINSCSAMYRLRELILGHHLEWNFKLGFLIGSQLEQVVIKVPRASAYIMTYMHNIIMFLAILKLSHLGT